jgi:hypothetical protein
MRKLVLVLAVVVHCPDLFVAGAIAHEIDLGFGNSRDSAAKAEDNFVCKFVSGGTSGLIRGGVGVLLAENLRRGDVLHIIKPALHDHAVRVDTKVSEGQHGCICRLIVPCLEFHFCRISGNLDRIKALGDQVENTGIIQIAPQSGIEHSEQVAVFRILIGGFEIRNSEPDSFYAETSPGLDPILGCGRNQQSCNNEREDRSDACNESFVARY